MTRTMPVRHERLTVRRVGGETLVLDTEEQLVLALRPDVSGIFDMCDGTTHVAAAEAQYGRDLVSAALAEFAAAGLLAGTSRRQVLQRGALVGAGALIASVAIPAAAAADTGRTTYDLYTTVAGQTTRTNPAGPFSFVQGPAGATTGLSPIPTAYTDTFHVEGFKDPNQYPRFWTHAYDMAEQPIATETFPPDSAFLHPGFSTSTSAIAQFTNPAGRSLAYSATATFTHTDYTQNDGGDGVVVYLYDAATQASGSGAHIQSTSSDLASITLTLSGTLDADASVFIAVALYGTNYHDSTQVSFTVTLG